MVAPLFRTISFPSELFRLRQGSFRLANFQTSSDAPLSNFVRVGGFIQQRWRCALDRSPEARENWQEWDAFMADLAGQVVLFNMRAPLRRFPLGSAAGFAPDNPEVPVDGVTIEGVKVLEGGNMAILSEDAPRHANAVKMEFPTTEASKTGVLRRGDLFGLNGNLYQVSGTVNTDASARATVPFNWRLWFGAAAGDVVRFRDPTVRMQLQEANAGTTQLSVDDSGASSFTAVEVPYTSLEAP